jgi:hypothetical protein
VYLASATVTALVFSAAIAWAHGILGGRMRFIVRVDVFGEIDAFSRGNAKGENGLSAEMGYSEIAESQNIHTDYHVFAAGNHHLSNSNHSEHRIVGQ